MKSRKCRRVKGRGHERDMRSEEEEIRHVKEEWGEVRN